MEHLIIFQTRLATCAGVLSLAKNSMRSKTYPLSVQLEYLQLATSKSQTSNEVTQKELRDVSFHEQIRNNLYLNYLINRRNEP